MLKFTSVSGSVPAITEDIIHTVTIIRTGPTIDLIIGPIIARTIGTGGTVTTGIVIHIITDARFNLEWPHRAGSMLFRASPIF